MLDKTTASTFFQVTCQEKIQALKKIARKTGQANKEKYHTAFSVHRERRHEGFDKAESLGRERGGGWGGERGPFSRKVPSPLPNFFRFPGRELCFVLIFITLMMPVEVRIVPTFQVAANLNFIDSYLGLVLPLIASATATFLYRQMFMTIPAELLEAARIDGAGPWRFFVDVVLPLSRTNTAALFVVLFIYGWNQYLWPLLVTNQESMYTIVMGIQRMVNIPDAVPEWNLIMAVALLGMLPPLLVVLGMQKLFVRGLVETEK